MNDLRKLTRIILVGLAIYILINAGMILVQVLPLLLLGNYSILSTHIFWTIVSSLLPIVFAGLVIYLLWYKADFFVEKIVGREETPKGQVLCLPFTFRLISVFTGILLLSRVVPSIMSSVRYLTAKQSSFGAPRYYQSWVGITGSIILLALSIYLLCGAPHFVRWQVKKTLEQCKQPSEPGKMTGEAV